MEQSLVEKVKQGKTNFTNNSEQHETFNALSDKVLQHESKRTCLQFIIVYYLLQSALHLNYTSFI